MRNSSSSNSKSNSMWFQIRDWKNSANFSLATHWDWRRASRAISSWLPCTQKMPTKFTAWNRGATMSGYSLSPNAVSCIRNFITQKWQRFKNKRFVQVQHGLLSCYGYWKMTATRIQPPKFRYTPELLFSSTKQLNFHIAINPIILFFFKKGGLFERNGGTNEKNDHDSWQSGKASIT